MVQPCGRRCQSSYCYWRILYFIFFTVSIPLTLNIWRALDYLQNSIDVSFAAPQQEIKSTISHDYDGRRKYKIHLWNDTSPKPTTNKETMYNQEGWSKHPRTKLVDSPDDADLIVWVTTRGNTEAEIPPRNYPNIPVVLLDYSDGCSLHQKRDQILNLWGYFKRSFVQRKEGLYTQNCSGTMEENIHPLAYSGAKAITNNDTSKPRKYAITNVLRTESDHNKGRAKIVNWTKSFIQKRGLENESIVGEVSTGYSASNWDQTYMDHLANSKIIVTSNPWEWEGDFRLWEGLSSGAMVMVDRMAILDYMPNALEDKKHLVFYDSTNLTNFEELLGYYVHHKEEAQMIGEAGYRFVVEHHMTTDRVTYILDTLESKKSKEAREDNDNHHIALQDAAKEGAASTSTSISTSSQNKGVWDSKDSGK